MKLIPFLPRVHRLSICLSEKELKNLAEGNGAKPITLRENDEFHDLASAFNDILAKKQNL